MSDGEQPETPASWGARFGWIAGGLIGLLAGFFATYGVEKLVLHRTSDPLGIAARLSSVIVPAFFLAGALGGHAFGGRGGATRYKWLGVASGVLISTVAWAALVLLRR
jgi:hypothetical protein